MLSTHLCIQLCHLPVSSSQLLLTLVRDGILYIIHLCILPVIGRMSAISVSYVVMGFFFLLWLLWTDIQICRSPQAKITLGFTVKSKFMPAYAMSHKHNSQGQHSLQDSILQIADSSTVTMWFSSLMKGFSSQSLTRALKSLAVYPPSYSTVASVRPQERLLTKHGLSILPQLLGCSDIHHSWDQEAPENYQRAWRGKRDIGSFHNE